MTRQVTPHLDAEFRKEKALETVAGITYADNFASISGYRIKCGMTHAVNHDCIVSDILFYPLIIYFTFNSNSLNRIIR